MTITLTPDPSTASITVDVDGLGTDPVTILRTNVSGSLTALRGSPFTPAAGIVRAIDAEAPLGVPVTYKVQGTTEVAVTTLDVDVPILSSPLSPELAAPVTVVDDGEWSYPARTYAYDVIGRGLPVFTWYARASRTGRLVLRYADTQERSYIAALVAPGAPLLLRYPAAYPQLPSAYIGILDVRQLPAFPGDTAGTAELDYIVVPPPPSSLARPGGALRWDDVPIEWTTWNAVLSDVATWTDLTYWIPSTAAAASPPPWGA